MPSNADHHNTPLDVAFARRFAAFLRQNRYRWCTRRTDLFQPLDVDLATQHLVIEGVISDALIESFLVENEDVRPLIEDRADDEVISFLPVALLPKILLLDLSIRDAAGHDLVLASRIDDAAIGAIHILGLLRAQGFQPRSEDEVASIMTILATLSYLNPHQLVVRTERWARAQGLSRKSRARPLQGSDLDAWIRDEGNAFVDGLGSDLVEGNATLKGGYQELVSRASSAALLIPPAFAHDGLATFTKIEDLLLHAIRDMLRVTAELTASFSPLPDEAMETPKQEGSLSPEDLLKQRLLARVSGHVVPGLSLLAEAKTSADDHPYYDELVRNIDSSVAHVVATVVPNQQFRIDLEHTVKLRKTVRRFDQLRRTLHEYPFPLGDAPSVHLEVQLANPELRISQPRAKAELQKGYGAALRKRERIEKSNFFEEVERASDRLFHFYSSRRLDEAESTLSPGLSVLMPIRLTRGVWFGFLIAQCALLAAAGFVVFVSWWQGFYRGERSDLVPEAITLGAIGVTVILWLIQNQYGAPLVARKLRWPRWGFYITAGVIVVSLISLGVCAATGGLKPDSKGDSSSLAQLITREHLLKPT